jgi:plasmid stabilization system protein ParE
MAASKFDVALSRNALIDLDEILVYWAECNEPERGEQYARDLYGKAKRALSDPLVAQSGRPLRESKHPNVRELIVFKRSYRILYRINTAENTVEVLRFWHSHRDEPFQE